MDETIVYETTSLTPDGANNAGRNGKARGSMRTASPFPIDMVINMTNNMTMLKVNVHEAKAHLSRYLEAVAAGETVVICNRNRPVAELRALPRPTVTPRLIGLGRGTFVVPDSFFDPLPNDIVDVFNGAE